MKNFVYGSMAALIILAASCSKSSVNPPKNPPVDTTKTVTPTSLYLTNARSTHGYIANNYLTSYGSYRVNTTTNTGSAFEWYNASQLYADAEMVSLGDQSYLQYMNNTFTWLQKLIDKADTSGGYFASAGLDGSGGSGLKYVDDNSLTGMAYLAAYDVTTGTTQTNYLNAAKGCADWLMYSGQWDSTLGGGFWWNTDKTVKPTQSNALALQLFSRLYKITGQSIYHDWAVQINTWLNTKMYGTNGLYIWQIEANGTVDSQNFTYDNAIMVEADLLYGQAMNDNTYLTKAQALGNAMIKTLWDVTHNVFIFNTTDIRVNPCYSGWASQAMVKLYESDNNNTWLTYAKGNIDQINNVLRNSAFGYYNYAGLDGSGRYTNLEGVDQAWMQRVQGLLSKYK
ncbi:glycoside hydrolase family 76 protein [Mucilaginibacter sp.]